MNKNNVTIYDIAREVGASPATVSRVMNNSTHPVKHELRERIKEVSRQLGYIPNFQARSLKNQTSTSVGVIIPSIANPFYPSIVRGIEDEMVSRNYHMIISSCDRNIERTNYSIENMLAVNVQGIISIYMDETPEALRKLVERGGVAVNVVANDICQPNMHTILVNKIAECELAVNHILELGHKRVAILLDKLDNTIRMKRQEGYRYTLEQAGQPYDPNLVYIWGRDVTGDTEDPAVKGYLLTKTMLERTPDVTAFICMNDNIALGAIRAIREAGKRIPEDYSMISFDDLIFADSVYPALTTVGLDKYNWGRKLAQYYFQKAENSQERESVAREDEVLISSKLIVRQSTKKV